MAHAVKGREYPSLISDPMGVKNFSPADPKEIDLSISRRLDRLPPEIRRQLRRQANNFIRKQRVLESNLDKNELKDEQDQLRMRREFDAKTLHQIMMHPLYLRMIKKVTEEMLEEGLWRRYKPHGMIKDSESSRRRIQHTVPRHVMEYVIKYDKKPWRYPGKNKIKTKFYDRVDWLDDPFVVLEEKTEKKFEKAKVKA